MSPHVPFQIYFYIDYVQYQAFLAEILKHFKRLYIVCSIFQVKFVLKMVVIVCSTLVIVCSTGRLNFVLQKKYRFSLFYKKMAGLVCSIMRGKR